MASGFKSVKINTQERAVSTDINRLQLMAAAGVMELFRYMLDVTGNDDLDAAGIIVEHNALETPMRGEIVSGLLVKPQSGAGVLDLLVDPGVAMVVAPDSDPDSSPYKFVKDPGIPAPGTIAMTANGGGSPRIDVVEVQWSSVVTETDNRDVFNTTTGLFVAANVTKATQGTVTTVGGAGNIRVRAGVVGAGMPALASGWMPLMVAFVPAGATANDQMDFYDVRPLLADREFQPFALQSARPKLRKVLINAASLSNTIGIVEAHSGGRRLGGRLRRGTPGVDADSVDLGAANQEGGGAAFVAGQPYYIYLVTPFGLPRWARYTRSAPRLPRSPRGILVVSGTQPDQNGVPIAPVLLPNGCGFNGAASQSAVCIAAGAALAGPTQEPFMVSDGETILNSGGGGTAALAPVVVGNKSTWTFLSGQHYPPNATHIRITFTNFLTITPGGAGNVQTWASIDVYDQNGTGTFFDQHEHHAFTYYSAAGGATDTKDKFSVWIPVPTIYAGAVNPLVVAIEFTGGQGNAGGVTIAPNAGLSGAQITGWRLG